MLRNAMIKLVFLTSAMASSVTFAGDEGTDLGLSVEGGYIYLRSYNPRETNKVGSSLGAQIFVRRSAWEGYYQLGLGGFDVNLEGKDRGDGFENQKLAFRTLLVDGRYLFQLPLGFDLGVSVRGLFGESADYAVQSVNRNTQNLMVGPIANYTYRPSEDWSFGVYGAAYMNVDQRERQVNHPVVGLSVAYTFGAGKAQTSKAVQSTDVEIPVKLADDVALFAFGKSDIKAPLKRRLRNLGLALAKEGSSMGPIRVSGHTDSYGPRWVNDPLSKSRARAVCDVFEEAGVDRDLLTCQGYADDRPLPNYRTTAPQQRRAALIVIAVKPSRAEELKQMIENTINK